jgi:RNA polymerase sigma-70 factor (ECF subfamily)
MKPCRHEPGVEESDARAPLLPLIADLRAYARFLAPQRAEADDLVQEALVRALAALAQFRQGTSMRAWLFVILRNAFYEQARRRRSERAALQHAPAADAVGAPAQYARADLADLQSQLFTLPPLLREALVLVGAQGMSYEEAAEICNVPVGTMKARVSRARAQLAHLMHGTVPDQAETPESGAP